MQAENEEQVSNKNPKLKAKSLAYGLMKILFPHQHVYIFTIYIMNIKENILDVCGEEIAWKSFMAGY